ncbi:MAG TPA: GntR family transcriptional regulator [Streptosporangiaceae bacterium]|nr:GntR family transcriptional regulator [Streptosporangiaceae bacterium]
MDKAVFPALRVVPDRQAEGSAYRQVASGLRRAIAAGQYPAGRRLPTEAELVTATGLSRQTVRRAFQELVTDGAIYRVRGRGTFAVPGDGKYLRSFGSVDDLMALSLDTEMQVVEPLHVLASLEAAASLQVDDDIVMCMSFVRLHEGSPFCFTRVHVPMELGRRLAGLPEMAGLTEPGTRGRVTVISLLERVSDHPIHGALQNATAEAATPELARRLGCAAGLPVLRIDRLYRDRELRPLELAVNHFNPDRYSYRLQLRRVDAAVPQAGPL